MADAGETQARPGSALGHFGEQAAEAALQVGLESEESANLGIQIDGTALAGGGGERFEPGQAGAGESEGPGDGGRAGEVAPVAGGARERGFDEGDVGAAPEGDAVGIVAAGGGRTDAAGCFGVVISGRAIAGERLGDQGFHERGGGRLAPLDGPVELEGLVEGGEQGRRGGEAHERAVGRIVAGGGLQSGRWRRHGGGVLGLLHGVAQHADGDGAGECYPGVERSGGGDSAYDMRRDAAERRAAVLAGERGGEGRKGRERLAQGREIAHPPPRAVEPLARVVVEPRKAERGPGAPPRESGRGAGQRHGDALEGAPQRKGQAIGPQDRPFKRRIGGRNRARGRAGSRWEQRHGRGLRDERGRIGRVRFLTQDEGMPHEPVLPRGEGHMEQGRLSGADPNARLAKNRGQKR